MTASDGADAAELCVLAERAARRGGAVALEHHLHATSRARLGREATRKSSRTDLATDADRASEAAVVATLLEVRPDDGILAEEGSARAGRSGITWVIDPLDGTTNFVYGFPGWAVSIAAVAAGPSGETTVAGVVYDPVRDECFTATRGGGSFLNGVRLRVDGHAPPLAEALVGTGFSYSASRRVAQARLLQTVLGDVRDIRRAGAAALDLCFVACGRLDAYYEAGLQPWDRAAGLLVASEAGAVHRQLDEPIDGAPTVAAAHRDLIDPLVALLNRAWRTAAGDRDGDRAAPPG